MEASRPSRPSAPVRVVLWRSLQEEGLDHCGLWRYPVAGLDQPGWALRGTAVASYDAVPTEIRYRVVCDDRWLTRTVRVGVLHAGQKGSLRLETAGDGRWFCDGEEVAAYRGCVDVDLGIGASTNTLPIRRLGLSVGQAAEIVAAWVRFPDLELSPLPQRYTRLAEDRYRYESLDSGFSADLVVDDQGMVVRYPQWCERIAVFDPAPGATTGMSS